MRGVIRLNDPTSHGGKVISASSGSTVQGVAVARKGDCCLCPMRGHEIGGPGPMTIKTDGHHWSGPASASTDLPSFGAGDLGRIPQLVRATDGKPVEGMQMYVEHAGESPVSGVSNSAGQGEKVVSDRLQKIRAIFYRPRK